MVSMIFRILVYDYNARCGNSLLGHLKARGFCMRCYNLKATMIHMYHPANEVECPKNIGYIIDVPLKIWRRCSKRIHGIVRESVDIGSMDFGVFVEDMISPVKQLTLLLNTMKFYASNIKMYESHIKTVKTLLPLPSKRVVYTQCSQEKVDSPKFCNSLM
ncbi:DUF3514 domain-containing protein [Ehrlichia sp. JZT12]